MHGSVYLDMELGEGTDAREVAKAVAHLLVFCWKQSVDGWRKTGNCAAFSSPCENRLVDQEFYPSIREGRHCEGGCSEGDISTGSASDSVDLAQRGFVICSRCGGRRQYQVN